jgi:hypothetical protein
VQRRKFRETSGATVRMLTVRRNPYAMRGFDHVQRRFQVVPRPRPDGSSTHRGSSDDADGS